MQWILAFIRREPARVFAVVKAALVLAAAFYPRLTIEQREAALGFVSVVILLLGEGTRAMVVPVAKLVPKEPPP